MSVLLALVLVSQLLVTGFASSAEARPARKTSSLPALPSKPIPKRILYIPNGDFSNPPPLEASADPALAVAMPFDRSKATVVARDELSTTFENLDGTETAEIHTSPINFRDEAGDWHPINNKLQNGPSGRFHNTSGPAKIEFAATAGEPSLLTVSRPGWSFAMSLKGAQHSSRGSARESDVRYPEVFEGADLVYSVRGYSVKEFLILKNPGSAGTGAFSFPIEVQGLTPTPSVSGGIAFLDASREEKLSIPDGVAYDSAEPVASFAPVKVVLVAGEDGYSIEAAVDPAWMRDQSRVYPITVDPTVIIGRKTNPSDSQDAYASSKCGTCNYNGTSQAEDGHKRVLKVGYDSSSNEYYSFVQYDFTSVLGKRIVKADWRALAYDAKTYPNTYRMWRVVDPWADSTITWNTRPNHDANYKESQVTGANQWVSVDLTDWVRNWAGSNPANGTWTNNGFSMDTAGNTSYFTQFGADEMSSLGEDHYLEVTHNQLPQAAVAKSPPDGAVTSTVTPTLSVEPATDPDGSPVKYWFRVASGKTGDTGQVLNSGWLDQTSWTVPAGTLIDGASYYWKVFTYDGTEQVSSTWAYKLKFDLRLGDQPTSAYDDFGPGRINLTNGNLVVAAQTPQYQTVGGPIGLSFTYNSQTQPVYGLTASYYNGAYQNGFPSEPTLVRRDSQVSFNWGTGSPGSGVNADDFLVRWTGFITVPYSDNNWVFLLDSDDGVRMWVGGQLCIDNWTEKGYSQSGQCGPLNLTANQAVSVIIEYFERGGAAAIQLRHGTPIQGVTPSSWLSPTALALPQGWSLSADSFSDLSYRESVMLSDSVILLDSSGAPYEYRKTSSGGYEPTGTETGYLANDPGGGLILHASDGVVYLFDRNGKLTEARSAVDDLQPAAPVYGWDSQSGRLTSIRDQVSGRAISLRYATHDPLKQYDPQCLRDPNALVPEPGFHHAPPGVLCKITYWDQKTTFLWYISNQLARIENPGGEISDFGYESGRVKRIRTPLAADLIATGTRADDDSTRSVVAYDSLGRLSEVTFPAPTSGVPRPKHSYAYSPPTKTEMSIAGLVGVQRTITTDVNGRLASDANAAGNTTRFAWDSSDRLRFTVDPTGLKSTTVYDQNHRPIETYGPAPESWFPPASQNDDRPLASFSMTTPKAVTNYDEGIRGLAATYWGNISLSGTAASHETVSDYAPNPGALVRNWGTGQPPNVSSGDNWSSRFTGEILFPASGTYTIRVNSDDGVRVFIDDKPIIDDWRDAAAFRNGTYSSPSPGTWRRIRIDHYEHGGGAQMELHWTTPAGVAELVPGANLRPSYGLVTSKIDPDNKATANEYGSRPELGLLQATIIDPGTGKLNLRTSIEYNDSYFRRTRRTLPRGPETRVTYSYYGSTEGRSNPCVSGSPSVNQGGLLKTTTNADPDGSGTSFSSIVTEFVYDQAGRAIAKKVSGDSLWACMTYDDRGRLASEKDRDGRLSTTSYSGAKTTVNFFDSDGTARSTVEELDMLGRLRVYTDENVTETRRTYDQAGRPYEVFRKFSGRLEALIARFAYDIASRVRSVTDYLSSTSGRTTTYDYDAAGRLKKTTRPNGVVSDTAYETNTGRLDTINHVKGSGSGTETLSFWDYDRSLAGRVSRETGGGRTRQFVYDGAARLSSVTEGASVRNYSYDANSNRCANASSCTSPTYQYHFDDRIKSSPLASSYSYDNRGNVTGASPTYQSSTQNRSWSFAFTTLMPNKFFPVGVGQNGTLNASLSWSTPFTRSATQVSSLNPGETQSFPLQVDQESFISSSLNWSEGTYPQTFSDPISVSAASSATKEISFEAAGDLSASMEWDPVSKGYSESGQVSSTSDHAVTASGNGNLSFTLTWPVGTPTNPNLDLLLLNSQGLVVASSTQLTGNSESVSFDVTNLGNYPSSSTYTLRVVAVGPGSDYLLAGSYPVSPTFDLQLESADGQVLAASSLESGLRKRTLSYPGAANGTYRYRITSSDEGGIAILRETHPTSSRAPLTLALKDPSGAVLKTFTSDSGTIQLSHQATAVGEYALEVHNLSSSVGVPFLAMPWSVTALKSASSSGSLLAGGSATHEVTADAAGYMKSSVTWTQGVGRDNQVTSGNVVAGQSVDKTISPTADGDISVELDWGASSTSEVWQDAVPTFSSWDQSIFAGASGMLTANLSWPEAIPNPDLDLYLIDPSTGAQLAASEALTGNSESISYQVSGITYPSTKEYALRVRSKAAGSSFTLSSTWPVTANLNLELYNPSGIKIASSYSSETPLR